MRHATKWNDKDLLQDEPFYSAFLQLRGRRCTPDKRFFGELVKKVKGLKFGVRSGGIPQ
jgi:hypothetical protein